MVIRGGTADVCVSSALPEPAAAGSTPAKRIKTKRPSASKAASVSSGQLEAKLPNSPQAGCMAPAAGGSAQLQQAVPLTHAIYMPQQMNQQQQQQQQQQAFTYPSACQYSSGSLINASSAISCSPLPSASSVLNSFGGHAPSHSSNSHGQLVMEDLHTFLLNDDNQVIRPVSSLMLKNEMPFDLVDGNVLTVLSNSSTDSASTQSDKESVVTGVGDAKQGRLTRQATLRLINAEQRAGKPAAVAADATEGNIRRSPRLSGTRKPGMPLLTSLGSVAGTSRRSKTVNSFLRAAGLNRLQPIFNKKRIFYMKCLESKEENVRLFENALSELNAIWTQTKPGHNKYMHDVRNANFQKWHFILSYLSSCLLTRFLTSKPIKVLRSTPRDFLQPIP